MPDCSDCCIYREYYPTKEFGKIGVLLLPEEKEKIEQLAREKNISIRILPRIAVGKVKPERVIAYQMMGAMPNGDLCPFLDRKNRSPHGGFACSIYKDRPLACSAYPVIGVDDDKAAAAAIIDQNCQFCKQQQRQGKKSKRATGGRASLEGIEKELESLARIKSSVQANAGEQVWRYATATGSDECEAMLLEGWVLER
ncbi:YkgJ family cysteine cluster protein [Nitrososphaera sp.]|uniref:YkgJ family cysteine cluster protein n=1 Tax=Nitrososphaera sp. TaxID=1971748 RepID=UPI00307EAD81